MIIDNTEGIISDLAGITSISHFDIRPQQDSRIRDTYFDTKQGLLEKQQISLRIRRLNRTRLLTIKSNPQSLSMMGVRRREFELVWSYESIGRMARWLNLKTPVSSSRKFSRLRPSDVLTEMGLRMVQDRTTSRHASDIFRRDKPRTEPVAELDFDQVTFLGKTRVQISELEIEAKGKRSVGTIKEIGETLSSLYPEHLREWPHGKFATGKTIQKLLTTGDLQRFLNGGRPKPEAFALIEQTLLSQALVV